MSSAARLVKIFVSWAHVDRRWKEPLMADLQAAVQLLRGVRVLWWLDSHLSCGEAVTPAIRARVGEADFGLLLVSMNYLTRPFILRDELPQFVGASAGSGALPVALAPFPRFEAGWDLRGLEKLLVFDHEGRSYAELSVTRRRVFAQELAGAIRRRALGLDGYDVA